MKPTILILTVLLMAFLGCKKDKDVATNSDLLTEKTWIHDNEMVDTNKNGKPDDEMGQQKNISFDFRNDGTLVYTKEKAVHQLIWKFENSESSIKITGIMDSLTIPYLMESSHSIFQLDENSLVFYVPASADYPETGTFQMYKHE